MITNIQIENVRLVNKTKLGSEGTEIGPSAIVKGTFEVNGVLVSFSKMFVTLEDDTFYIHLVKKIEAQLTEDKK